MVQAADFGELDNATLGRPLDRPMVRRVLAKREMGPRAVVVGEVPPERSPQVPLAQNDDIGRGTPAGSSL